MVKIGGFQKGVTAMDLPPQQEIVMYFDKNAYMHDLCHMRAQDKKQELVRRLAKDLIESYNFLCECEGDSDRDQDRAGYGRYGGTTDFDHHDFEQHRQAHVKRSWEHTKEAGISIMQGVGNALAGREDEAIENFAMAAKEIGEAFMDKWTADAYDETIREFYTEY